MSVVDSNNDLNYIRFDVGHQFFTSHKSTILAGGQDSLLAKLISPEFDKRKSALDYIVIDRDGKHFGTILNYLRDRRSLNFSNFSDDDLNELSREADYYCLFDLLDDCDGEMDNRIGKRLQQIDISDKPYLVPENQKLEIIYGSETMLKLMSSSKRRVIVISYKSLKRFHIDSWFEELVTMYCDYSKNVVYCYSGEDSHKILNDFILLFYDPNEARVIKRVKAPDEEKFKARRTRYKFKIFKYWFVNSQ